ncbi:XRE family transcriptional regulator [Streptomyces sp. NPDC087440]|uniref:XRE family transcriptional regulator n=1 Tax=Streptomyces sp. NPDC087440 TaxID=3365790 RepID=UPI0038284DB0
MDRRDFLAYSGAALGALAQQWAHLDAASAAPGRGSSAVGAADVGWLEETGSRLTGLVTEQRQYAAQLLDAHLATVTDLIEQGRYEAGVGLRLHRLGASLSQAVGWHRFDQGQHAAAARFWHGALHGAQAAGDRDMGAGVLSDLAYQTTWLGDPRTAVDILGHTVRRTRHPAARSLLHLRLARAQAATGDAAGSRGSLAAAERAWAEAGAHPDPAPAWCAWMSDADLAVDSGRCLLDAGDVRGALRLMDEGARLLPGARAKTRAVFLTYEADAHLRAGEIDRAAVTARESLELARRIGAPRCLALVRGLGPGFVPHGGVAGVDALLVGMG